MATITPTPLFMKDALFTIADEYAAAISSVAFTPTTSAITFQGLRPTASYVANSASTWTCDITFVQDFDTAGSLSNYLAANEGSTVSVTFVPKNGGASITATLVIAPGAIGGAVNTAATATVSLGVQGKPTIVPATATIPIITGASVTGGGIAGGNVVKITGSKFTGTTSVKFGTVASASFVIDSDQVVYAVAPAQAAGSKPITVTNAVGVSTTTAPYTYA